MTRPDARSAELTRHLEAQGARILHVPLVATAAPSDGGAALAASLQHATDFAWIVVTSASAVDALVKTAPGSHDWPDVPAWAAVGPATARQLRRAGAAVSLVASRARADVLAAEFPVPPPEGGRVLLVQAEQPHMNLEKPLAAKGWTVERVAAYRTLLTTPSADQLGALRTSEVITLASPSAATNLVTLGVRTVPVVCIGEVTAESARAQGLQVAAVAGEPNAGAFVRAVVAALGLDT